MGPLASYAYSLMKTSGIRVSWTTDLFNTYAKVHFPISPEAFSDFSMNLICRMYRCLVVCYWLIMTKLDEKGLWEGFYHNHTASVFTFSFWAHSSMTSAKLKYSGTWKLFVPQITVSAISEVALQASSRNDNSLRSSETLKLIFSYAKKGPFLETLENKVAFVAAVSFPFPKKHAVAGMRRRKDSFAPQPLPIFVHPLPTCPQFLAYPRRAPPSLARSISTPKGRETAATQAKKKQLLFSIENILQRLVKTTWT